MLAESSDEMKDGSFNDYPLSPEVRKAIKLLHYESPTKVQELVIPAALDQKDIIVQSQTGSGKTAAFGIPVCELVAWEENKPQALVLTPTRELAIQVKEDLFNIGRFKRLKVVVIYGKTPFHYQEKELKQKTHIVVGTPGRLIDHLERGTLDTSQIRYLIIDEADEMLNMGFIEQIETIISTLPQERMTILLSATMSSDIKNLCDRYMEEPTYLEIEEANKAVDRIRQEKYNIAEIAKLDLLTDILIIENPDSCLIFCNTKQRVDDVFAELRKLNISCEKIHGGMEQRDRLHVMEDFKLGYFRYLVATDVAARGIDIESISMVINYDVPQESESYVHRIGRTGRRDKLGKAISFVNETDDKYIKDIQDYIGKEIENKEIPQEKIVLEAKHQFWEKNHQLPEIKERKGSQLNTEIMKLHINAGKKTKMRPVDIVGTLCSIPGIGADDIGIINVLDVSTYVEILNNKGDVVWEELQSKPIKGRIRKVSIVK